MNAASIVHAFALGEPMRDMFGPADVAPPGQAPHKAARRTRPENIEFTGVLLSAAEVRTKATPDGTAAVPVLCLDLGRIGPGQHRIHVEQIYPADARKDAQAKAASLPKGTRVTVVSGLADMRISLPHVESIIPFTGADAPQAHP